MEKIKEVKHCWSDMSGVTLLFDDGSAHFIPADKLDNFKVKEAEDKYEID